MNFMKSTILILCFMIIAPFTIQAQWFYRHKSEAKIAAMTPEQRIDEWVKEYSHRFDLSDEQRGLIRKYIELDGLKALPRAIDYLNEYDPTRPNGNKIRNIDRFESCQIMLGFIDGFAVRLRASEEGRRAIDALERSAKRMRAAGFRIDQVEYNSDNSLLKVTEIKIKQAKNIGSTDETIQDTFRFLYKIKLSDAELLDFSNYLTERYPDYPSWSKGKTVKDNTEISPAGLPVINTMLEKPERYYEAYLEFKKTK